MYNLTSGVRSVVLKGKKRGAMRERSESNVRSMGERCEIVIYAMLRASGS